MRIKKLALRNFKGIRSFETDFNDVTHIFGANGTGKTTLVDAYTWLLFDKDSSNRANFNVKTLDENNEPIHNLEHEVFAIIQNKNHEITLRKVLVEKWVKKRGSSEPEFSGHETEYFINDVPKKKSEYQDFINSIVSEDVFKLLSNPSYFASLPWQKQREMLFTIAGDVSDVIIASGNTKYENLLATIAQKQTSIIDYNKELSNKIRKLKGELETIPARLDEVDRDKPDVENWDDLNNQIDALKSELEGLNGSIDGMKKNIMADNDKINALRVTLNRLEGEKSRAIDVARSEALKERDIAIKNKQVIQDQISELSNSLIAMKKDSERLAKEKEAKEEQIVKLRERWFKENESLPSFDIATCCPTCKRDFEPEKINEERQLAMERFNANKADRLAIINKEGLTLKEDLALLIKQIEEKQTSIKEGDSGLSQLLKSRDTFIIPQIPDFAVSGDFDSEISKVKDEIRLLGEKTSNIDGSLESRRSQILNEIRTLEIKLNNKVLIEKAEKRKSELVEIEKTISQEIADCEKIQDTITSFTKDKILQIESKVNGLFKVVKFKLFNQQINGGESETCEVLVNGVPWSDLNTAMKINAGIDIINALSEHFNISAPVWIDNRESVINLIDTGAQIINLYVSKEDSCLRIA